MNASLTPEQGIALFKQLASDDGFRRRFESDPPSAMAEAGIDPELCKTLSSKCCKPQKLADKQVFADLLDDLESEEFRQALEMETPKVSID